MEVLNLLTHLINAIFIKGLFISILSIMVLGKILKTDTLNAFLIIKALILFYATLNISYYLIGYFAPATMVTFFGRANGSYSFAYYSMLLSNTLLPFLLLFKKPGRNIYVLLTLSFLINFGWMFELFIIYITNLHRGHIANQLSFNYLWFLVLNGVVSGSVIYAIGRAVKRKTADIHASVS